MATNWWWVFPASEAANYSNSATPPPGTVIFSTSSGSGDDNALHSGGTVLVKGQSYSRWIGPFGSQADANSHKTADTSNAAGIKAGIEAGNAEAGALGLPAVPGVGGVGNPLAALASLEALYKQLTKLSMWRSFGWLVLGGAMLGGGIAWWAKKEEGSIVSGLTGLKTGQKPSLQAPVIPLGLMMAGIYLMWFGVAYWEDTKTVWPSDPVKALLQGQGLPARQTDTTATAILDAAVQADNTSASGSGSGTGSAALPAGASGSAQEQAQGLLSKHGWSASQLVPLVSLWNQESGWNPEARNPSSGAFGIAQALGHGVPGGAAPDGTNEYGGWGLSAVQAKAANGGSAYWQIVWGLNYIAGKYGSPQAAWQHETANNWY